MTAPTTQLTAAGLGQGLKFGQASGLDLSTNFRIWGRKPRSDIRLATADRYRGWNENTASLQKIVDQNDSLHDEFEALMMSRLDTLQMWYARIRIRITVAERNVKRDLQPQNRCHGGPAGSENRYFLGRFIQIWLGEFASLRIFHQMLCNTLTKKSQNQSWWKSNQGGIRTIHMFCTLVVHIIYFYFITLQPRRLMMSPSSFEGRSVPITPALKIYHAYEKGRSSLPLPWLSPSYWDREISCKVS